MTSEQQDISEMDGEQVSSEEADKVMEAVCVKFGLDPKTVTAMQAEAHDETRVRIQVELLLYMNANDFADLLKQTLKED